MEEIKVVLVNSWWRDPYLIALFSSVLTGLFFALVLRLHSRFLEKRDVLSSVTSELAENYNSLKKLQDLSEIKGLEKNDGMIKAIRESMPWNEALNDEQVILDYFKNMPMDDQLSIDCWIKLQSQIAKYSTEYPKYNEIYSIMKRIIRFSKIKSGEINSTNIAEKAAVNQLGAIRINSTEFLKNYEDNFLKK